jgi:hypothetical protein
MSETTMGILIMATPVVGAIISIIAIWPRNQSTKQPKDMKTEEIFGLYVGQLIFDIDSDKTYSWNGSDWTQVLNPYTLIIKPQPHER